LTAACEDLSTLFLSERTLRREPLKTARLRVREGSCALGHLAVQAVQLSQPLLQMCQQVTDLGGRDSLPQDLQGQMRGVLNRQPLPESSLAIRLDRSH
jgi:hypothetical protein